MAKYKTTITEKDGTKSSGYIENGRSYYDNGKEINAGASVTDAQGKTWTKGGTTSTTNNKQSEIDMISAAIKANNSSSGGSSYKPSYGAIGDNIQTNPYEDEIDRIREAYERQQNQIREQNRIAVEQGTNRLNAQKANINQAAEDNARQAYIMHMQAKKALPQQLVNQGATGGMTETANLGLQTTYQNNLNDINRNKINAIQEIDNAIVDLKNTGNLATVEQVLANNQAALDSYMSLLDKGVAYNQWANQYNSNRADNAYTQAYKEREYADMLKQQALQNEMWQKEYDAEQKKYKDTLNQKNQQLANEQKTILNNISDTAFAMHKSEEYTPQDVIAYITGQSALTDQQQYDILKSLGLI